MAILIQTKVCSNPECMHLGAEQTLENFNRVRKDSAAYRARCKDCLRAYYQANAESIRADRREYMRGRANENRIQSARWRKNNPDKVTANTRRRKARIRGSQTEPYNSIQIFERDSWTCGICHEGIDSLLRWPDPNSKSIDHILPVSMGGADVAENVRATHLRCNVLRGNGTRHETMELV